MQTTQVIPLIDSLKMQPSYYCMDMGYDTKTIYYALRIHKAQAIIPLNRQEKKDPPKGL